jgi:hypothetical protein
MAKRGLRGDLNNIWKAAIIIIAIIAILALILSIINNKPQFSPPSLEYVQPPYYEEITTQCDIYEAYYSYWAQTCVDFDCHWFDIPCLEEEIIACTKASHYYNQLREHCSTQEPNTG